MASQGIIRDVQIARIFLSKERKNGQNQQTADRTVRDNS